MGKSIIPFILGNTKIKKIFVDLSSSKDLSKVFSFQALELNELNKSNVFILLTDKDALKNVLEQNAKINKILLINDSNNDYLDVQSDSEIIIINTPLRVKETCIRIENIFTQKNINKKRLYTFKYFTYDPSTRTLSNKLKSLRFTDKESQIFLCLVQNQYSHISKKDLLNKVWSYRENIDTHTLETHVYGLRKKIEKEISLKKLINFEEKKGYYLDKTIL